MNVTRRRVGSQKYPDPPTRLDGGTWKLIVVTEDVGWKAEIRRLLSPGYVEKLRARDAKELLLRHGGLCGLIAGIGSVLVVAVSVDKGTWRDHVTACVALLVLAVVAVTAFVALRPRPMLRPATVLRLHALLLLGVAVGLAVDLTDVALFAPRPVHNFSWVPFASPMLTTYAVALFAATWSRARARYLTTAIGSLVFAWELVLLAELLVLNP